MEYVTTKKIAEIWGLTTQHVQILCKQGKIYGITHFGKVWAITKNSQKPADGRHWKAKKMIRSKFDS